MMKTPFMIGTMMGFLSVLGLLSSCRPPEKMVGEEEASESSGSSEISGSGPAVAGEPDYGEVVDYLLTFARSTDTNRPLDQKAISLAAWLDPKSKEVFDADFLLKNENRVEEDESAPGAFDLVSKAKPILKSLEPYETHKSQDVRIFLADLLLALAPEDTELAYTMRQMEVVGARVRWGRFVRETADGEFSLAANQATIKGLLVQELDDGRVAGKASQMNATVVGASEGDDLEVVFNQGVGQMMLSALKEVEKFHAVRHEAIPKAVKVEIAFENQYSDKDGPSAAVACALLLESLISGKPITEELAVTGDMNADGLIKPVGGIDGKIRGATHRDCRLIGLPERNASAVLDLMMIEGPSDLIAIQIFSMANFEEALVLSRVAEERPQELNQAIEEFARIQEVLGKPDGESWLTNQFVIERLQKVTELAPHHLSARYLLMRAQGREPEKLTLEGSLTMITHSAEPLIRAIRQRRFDPEKSSLNEDAYADALFALKRARTRLDQRTWKCADAITEFAGLMREFVNNRPKSYNNVMKAVEEIQAAGANVDREYDTLLNQVDVREELIE